MRALGRDLEASHAALSKTIRQPSWQISITHALLHVPVEIQGLMAWGPQQTGPTLSQLELFPGLEKTFIMSTITFWKAVPLTN